MKEKIIDISEDDKDDDDKDPQPKSLLRNSKKPGNSCAIEGKKVDQVQKRSRKVVDGGNADKGKKVRPKKKETDDEVDDDVEILDLASVSEGNLSPFVPSSIRTLALVLIPSRSSPKTLIDDSVTDKPRKNCDIIKSVENKESRV